MNQSVVAIQRKTKIEAMPPRPRITHQKAASEAMPPMRRQSAARLPSLARYGVRAVESGNEAQGLVAKPRTPHLHCAARAALQAQSLQCAGSRGKTPCLSLGVQKGVFSSEREYPLFLAAAQSVAQLMKRSALQPPHPPLQGENKKRTLSPNERRSLLLVASVNLTDTSACRRWRGRGRRRRRS